MSAIRTPSVTDQRIRRAGPRRTLVCRLAPFPLLVLLLIFTSFSVVAADAERDYLLGMQDKVRIKVLEWRASRDEVFEWTALNTDYTVNPSGNISLPLIGDIPAAGLSTAALAVEISQRLKERIGLVGRLDVSVEVVQFRPFYIVGEVEKPGEYPFRPELTVLRALSIAGGLKRATELSLTRSISAMGEIQLNALEVNSLLARLARLKAELEDADEIDFPKALMERARTTSVALLMQQEKLILESRREALNTQLHAYEQLKTYLGKEVESLIAQLHALDKQAELFRREHEGVASLVSRGLAATSRQLELERAMASMEGDRLRLGTNLMKARQEISRTDIAILDLKNKRKTEITMELRQTQAKLEEAGQKLDTAQKLLNEAQVSASRLFAQENGSRRPEPQYSIVRQINGESQTIAATETTPVEPGDTVKVEFLINEEHSLGALHERTPALTSLLKRERRAETESHAGN